MFLKTININIPIIDNLRLFTKSEGMSNYDDDKDDSPEDKDDSPDSLKLSIENTQLFAKLPTPFQLDSSLSFLTRFDPSFKPPKYQPFQYKATLYTPKYKCTHSTTGMFTDCGPAASNSC